MDIRFKEPKTKAIMESCFEGFFLYAAELEKELYQLRVKAESSEASDAELRSLMGQIKGLKKAIAWVPKPEGK